MSDRLRQEIVDILSGQPPRKVKPNMRFTCDDAADELSVEALTLVSLIREPSWDPTGRQDALRRLNQALDSWEWRSRLESSDAVADDHSSPGS